MVVLDTDHLTLLEREETELAQRILERLDGESQDVVSTTIVTYEEQMRGWLAYIAKARKIADQVDAFGRLQKHLDRYRRIEVLPFNEKAGQEFERLRKLKVKIGTSDLRIASICLTHGATLYSRNLSDFQRVPGLNVVDATK